MSKIVYICCRNSSQAPYSPNDIELLSTRLTPDNISPLSPLILEGKGILAGIFNPVDSLPIKDLSICLGAFIGAKNNWWKPGAEAPDGSYALFRSNESTVELLSDIVASRTIWYVQTENVFIASTSQRAIVFFLQGYKPNRSVYPWMLSSGTLGPGLSWDSRIRCLEGNARLFLDRSSWDMTVAHEPAKFSSLDLPEKEHEKRLRKAIEDTFEHLHLDFSKWVLPLSGGFDSRAILMMLKDRKNLQCVTWGLKSSLNDELNDAYVAKTLAEHFKLEHRYFATDISKESVEKIFNRYLVAGEGRVDVISGYMDGFKTWKLLFEENIAGIIRGDEGFGWFLVSEPFDVKRVIGILSFRDYCNLKSLNELGLEKQTWPESLKQKENESLATWRDRLYHEFRIPFVLAALTDLKCCYVELINPLLSRRIIKQVRTIPDSLRTNKRLFKEIVRAKSPNIRFAERVAIDNPANILRSKHAVDLIIDELNSTYAKTLLSDKLINFIVQNVKISDTSSINISSRDILRAHIKNFLPKRLRNIIKKILKKPHVNIDIDVNILAFRAFIVCKIYKMLCKDAEALKKWN